MTTKEKNTTNYATADTSKSYDPCKEKPYNRYNIYYILERERLLQTHSDYESEAAAPAASSHSLITGYEYLDLPDLPPRYAHLKLSHDWYIPGKRKLAKRQHRTSHGIVSMKDIARHVSDTWKGIDGETLKYCTRFAKVLKDRHSELKRMGGVGCFGVASDSTNARESRDERASARPEPKIQYVFPAIMCTPTLEESIMSLGMPKTEDSIASSPAGMISAPSGCHPIVSPSDTLAVEECAPKIEDSAASLPAGMNDKTCVCQPIVSPYHTLAVEEFTPSDGSTVPTVICVSETDQDDAQETLFPRLPSMTPPVTTVPSVVDISDQDILAMWHN